MTNEKTLKAMANSQRLAILNMIANKEMNVGEIQKEVGLSQSATSQHLAILRNADIVKTRPLGNIVFYSIKNKNMMDILKNFRN